ncbi:MAG: excinuclease ABC subunit UvrA [Bacteroidales bacterium]
MPEGTIEGAIIVKGARVNNLKNIDLSIPRDQFIVVTGLSGSGKSSLAFDTIYAEGQRRYVESLSAYARQFLGRIHKPEVDYIKGLPPAIAIEQRVNTQNPRSTVGTSTEIYDYLKLLFARIGKTYSPVSGKLVKKHSVSEVVDYILGWPDGSRLLLACSLQLPTGKKTADILKDLISQGFTRLLVNGEVIRIDQISQAGKGLQLANARVVIDRLVVARDEDSISQYGDSVHTAFTAGHGECWIVNADDTSVAEQFSDRFEADGIVFEEPAVHTFSFNSPVGACPVCEGYGSMIGIDENLVIPNKGLSIYDDAVICWKGEKMQKWKEKLIYSAPQFGFPVHKPWRDLTPEQQKLVWTGNKHFKGLNDFFAYLEEKKYKIQYRVMLSRYRGRTVCTECLGGRLRKEALYVKVGGKNIQELVTMPISELCTFIKQLRLNAHDHGVAARIMTELNTRLEYLVNVGLGYLTLNRVSSSLSGGESQRINLATQLGSSLVGSIYILDEPSIGLHSRDTTLLIGVLKNLRELGNTVLVVEHDEEIMRASDYIIDIGPRAGAHGGEVVFAGKHKDLLKAGESLTAGYLIGNLTIPVPARRRKWNSFITLKGAREHNLKGIDVKFPLQVLTVVTGVSGSGKSSLVCDILYPALNKIINGSGERPGQYDDLTGDVSSLSALEFVDQNPIGKSSRSNPVTYLKAWDEIRKLYAVQPAAVHANLNASHFSFNVDGGRCEECQGEGIIRVEMQFMADVQLICESCHGKRFREEVLEIKYHGKNIFDILEFTVEEAIEFFSQFKGSTEKRVVEKIQPLADVGLGYIKLGQSSSTLSGGESQRVKLASFLGRERTAGHTLFIFDEPTTGLHFHDISRLLEAFEALIKRGNSIIVIEHNLDVIKSADWIIDLGPEGGVNGGGLVGEGTPETIAANKKSYTGSFLKEKLFL